MAIVIGKAGKNVREKDAMSYVFGFTTAHDVSARDWQLKRNGGQWLIGKTMDNFCPLGIQYHIFEMYLKYYDLYLINGNLLISLYILRTSFGHV